MIAAFPPPNALRNGAQLLAKEIHVTPLTMLKTRLRSKSELSDVCGFSMISAAVLEQKLFRLP